MELTIEENDQKSFDARKEYHEGITNLIKRREEESLAVRAKKIKEYFKDPEPLRKEVRAMFGWPLTEDLKLVSEPESDLLFTNEKYSVYRMQFEILEGLKMVGILTKMNTEEKLPLVIAQHGGAGTPELISGIYDHTGNYNDVVDRLIARNVHVFAPQILTWSKEWFGPTDYDRDADDIRLKRVGSSITAVEVFGMEKVLDYFEKQSWVKNFGMLGVSYGGFYTLVTTACDTRIKAAISAVYFNERTRYLGQDWTWKNAAYTASDAEIACMIYPRHFCIEIGKEDTFFDYTGAVKEFERVKELCKDVGTDWVEFLLFPDGHCFWTDDRPLDEMVDILKKE